MTVEQARKLRVGDRVRWVSDTDLPSCDGTVREATYAAVKIEWDDHKWALMPFHATEAPWRYLLALSEGGAA